MKTPFYLFSLSLLFLFLPTTAKSAIHVPKEKTGKWEHIVKDKKQTRQLKRLEKRIHKWKQKSNDGLWLKTLAYVILGFGVAAIVIGIVFMTNSFLSMGGSQFGLRSMLFGVFLILVSVFLIVG
ncbi:MAG: DUF898 domain-containing protein [Bacteroidetes bacterium]|nr:DUF898 domain-containing protein [Bacteroidota bacterium]